MDEGLGKLRGTGEIGGGIIGYAISGVQAFTVDTIGVPIIREGSSDLILYLWATGLQVGSVGHDATREGTTCFPEYPQSCLRSGMQE